MKWLILAIVILSTTFGDVLQALGMRRHGEIDDFRPDSLGRQALQAIRNPAIGGAVFAMTVAFFSFMALLSVADVSFASPATAGSYVLDTILARTLLKEHIDTRRWAGAALVAFGIFLLSR